MSSSDLALNQRTDVAGQLRVALFHMDWVSFVSMEVLQFCPLLWDAKVHSLKCHEYIGLLSFFLFWLIDLLTKLNMLKYKP